MSKNNNKAMLGNNIYIAKGNKVEFGGGCRINENVYIESASIGNDVLIAPNVSILSRMHEFSRTDIPMSLQGYQEEKKVIIEDNVWLGRNVVVLPGVTIGKGAIWGGIPAKAIKNRLKSI